MSNEIPFLSALGITLAVAVGVVIYLKRPLRRILIDLCGSEQRAGFWAAYADVVFVLVPVASLLLGQVIQASSASKVSEIKPPLFMVIDLLTWSLLGLIVAVFVIAMGVAAFIGTGLPRTPIAISPDQVNDLERLLAKVEEIRAREIVRRASNGGGSL
jgi:hypothetical protein